MNNLRRLEELLARTVENPVTGCMAWPGGGTRYGKVKMPRGRQMDAHRAIWTLTNGRIASHLFVCHKCDNPPCVNIEHLFLGTHADNMRDGWEKGRVIPPPPTRGTDQIQAKLTDAMALEIYTLVTTTSERHADIATAYGISRQKVGRIGQGKAWAHVTHAA